jgi:hypothetical protein
MSTQFMDEWGVLSIGPPKQADMAIMGYPILATVTSATKSDNEFPFVLVGRRRGKYHGENCDAENGFADSNYCAKGTQNTDDFVCDC